MKDQDLDKIFREALQKQEATPPKNLWDKIEVQLDREPPAIPMKRKQSGRLSWMPYAAAASLLLFLGLGYLAWLRTGQIEEQLAEVKSSVPNEQIGDKQPAPTTTQHEESLSSALPEATEEYTHQEQLTAAVPTMERTSSPVTTDSEQVATQDAMQVEEEKTADKQQLPVPPPKPMETLDEQYASTEPAKQDDQTATNHVQSQKPTYVEVTEVEPVKPLLERFDGEDDDMMFAQAINKKRKGLLNTVKNMVTENVSALTGREVDIRTDEEGSLRIDIGSTFVRNRNKNRKQ